MRNSLFYAYQQCNFYILYINQHLGVQEISFILWFNQQLSQNAGESFFENPQDKI